MDNASVYSEESLKRRIAKYGPGYFISSLIPDCEKEIIKSFPKSIEEYLSISKV